MTPAVQVPPAGHNRRIGQLLRELWCNRASRDDNRCHREQLRFLPAVLEVQQTPPSPVGRALVWILLSLTVIALAWACFGKVDIVVSAPGRIVPSGQVKSVQAIETGSVQAIHVRDGDRVVVGQELVSLDPTYAAADQERVAQQIAELAVELAWRRALDAWLVAGRDNNAPPAPVAAGMHGGQQARNLFVQHVTGITAQLESIKGERDATRSELGMARAEIARLQATLPILADRVTAYKTLYDAQYGAKVSYLEVLQQYTEMQRSLPVLQARERQLLDALTALEARVVASREEQRTQNLLRIAQLESEQAAAQQDARKASLHQRQQILRAPVTGTVQQLAVHTVGGVVTPAQELLKIVPEGDSIEVEALLQNRDIGFVRESQPAEVKIDTFNFTKYGVIGAKLINISDDAVEDERLGWAYKLRLKLASDSIAVDHRRVKLSPGMAVTAEIKTGQRRLIEFFLSPLLRYKNESVRER